MFRLLLISFTFFSVGASGQMLPEISSNVSDPFISSLYDSLMGDNLRIYTGKRFHEPISNKLIEGNIYYQDNDWTTGTLGYQGQVYSNVTMRYHMFLDRLIILSPTRNEAIEAPDNRIDFFIVHNKKFVRLLEPKPAYYTVLHNGSVSIFARYYTSRHEKNIHVSKLEDRRRYYIKKDNVITQVKSKPSVLKVLSEQKGELRKFLRQQKILFSKNRETALQLLGEEFDRLQKLK
ncbi:MAG TPA: hypothetical protein DHV26_14185 [Cytophagales bacterium]|nr:hypothetical protein [Cytophagales bacterium]